jgi:hypothetical protein
MPRTWYRADLVGLRNGINTSFTVPGLPPDAVSTVEIIFNGKLLYKVGISPAGPLECSITGSAVVVGLAPDPTAQLWVIVVSNDEVAIRVSIPIVQEERRTFYFGVEAYDKNLVFNEWLDKDISSITWSYNPIGGCGVADITLRRPYDELGDLSLEWGIEIWREPDLLGKPGARLDAPLPIQLGIAHYGNRELRWGGYVWEIERVLSDDEQVILRCDGWSRQLRRIFIPETTWENQDVGYIVRDLIERFVVPGTRILKTFELGLIPDTGIVIDSITFDAYASDCLRTLAEIAGNCEWGCLPNREFYFIAPSATTIKQTYAIGDRVLDYRPRSSADEIVNRIHLRGANGFKRTIELGELEPNYYKEHHEFVSAIQSDAVATLWAQSYAANHAIDSPSGQLVIGETDEWIESVGHPLGLLRVIGGPVMTSIGDRLESNVLVPGSFDPDIFDPAIFSTEDALSPEGALLPVKLGAMYGKNTDERFRISSIQYQPTEDALQITIGLGQRRHPLADIFGNINYRLTQQEQAQGL